MDISKFCKSPQDLAALKAELILTTEDLSLLQPEDWKLLSTKISPQSLTALKANAGPAPAAAPAAASVGGIFSSIKNPADAAKLKQQLILTADDVALLTPEQYACLQLSQETESFLKTMSAGPSSGPASPKLVSAILADKKDLATCEAQLIISLEDVARLTPEDWAVLKLSPASVSALKAALAGSSATKPHKFQPGKPMIDDDDIDSNDSDSSDDDDDSDSDEDVAPMAAKVTSGGKMMDKAQMSSGKNMKMKQINQAIRAGHRLALRAELEAIRRADDLARLQKKRAELVRLYKKYKACPEAA